jgi:MFS family permease
MSSLFRALKNRNYRLFFAGEAISMVGTWMQAVVQGWLVYKLSSSAFWLGAIAFCTQFSAFLVSPIAGVTADRIDRRKILMLVELAGMMQAFLLAILFLTGHIALWQIALLASVLGVCNSFEIITRHSFAVDIVGKADLTSAISLNSIIINGSRVAGPALAGLLIAWMNEGWCFLLNSLSYLATLFSLRAMRLERKGQATATTGARWFGHFADAIRYLRGVPGITRLMAVSTLVSFVGFPTGNLMPVFARDVLQGDATTLAWLTGMAGLGAVSGALLLSAWHGRPQASGRIRSTLTFSVFMVGVALLTLGLSRTLSLSMIACLLMGFFMMGAMPLINTRIQRLVDDSMRGRVLSVYTMTFLGATPIGSLLQGWAADHFGAGRVTATAGCVFMAVSIALLADSKLRARATEE